MVKKLFKHEFLAYARVMSVVYIILLTIALAGRVILLFENDSIPYQIISTISIITYVFSVWAVMVFAVVMGIIRFYKHLFTSEGYLTFTLPVTPTQHIVVKTVTALCIEMITFAVILLSGCVLTAGELLVEIWNVVVYIFGEFYELVGFHAVAFLGELLLLYLLQCVAGILLYYTYICIGQLFRKARILAAVGAYFAHYILSQIVASVISVMFSLVAITDALKELMQWLGDLVVAHPYATVHSGLWIAMLAPVTTILVTFLVVRTIITKKLNLE